VLRIYDLKGSLINRKTKTKTKDIQVISRKNNKKTKLMKSHFEGSKKDLKKKIQNEEKKEIANYKDVNFLESDDLFIIMGNKDKDFFIENLRKDAYFLTKHNIMDYSLLFVIAEENEQKQANNKNSYKLWRSLKSCPEFKTEIWSFALIDYLQEFNKFKYLESRYKELLNYKNSYYVSCINPKTYSERFINFMNSITCSLMTNRDSVV